MSAANSVRMMLGIDDADDDDDDDDDDEDSSCVDLLGESSKSSQALTIASAFSRMEATGKVISVIMLKDYG